MFSSPWVFSNGSSHAVALPEARLVPEVLFDHAFKDVCAFGDVSRVEVEWRETKPHEIGCAEVADDAMLARLAAGFDTDPVYDDLRVLEGSEEGTLRLRYDGGRNRVACEIAIHATEGWILSITTGEDDPTTHSFSAFNEWPGGIVVPRRITTHTEGTGPSSVLVIDDLDMVGAPPDAWFEPSSAMAQPGD